MSTLDQSKYAYVIPTNSIGVILDKGTDICGSWYRTDSDGVQDPMDLLFLQTKMDVRRCKKQMNATIAPSTRKLIGL